MYRSVRVSLLLVLVLLTSVTLPRATLAVSSTNLANPASITIPSSGTEGPASPYPSTITVAGVTGTITKVTVAFGNLSHTFPRDMDILLVGPMGHTVMLMSDVGGTFPQPTSR